MGAFLFVYMAISHFCFSGVGIVSVYVSLSLEF
jgi:hypothetical protein